MIKRQLGFFHVKHIPPIFWSFCDQTLQFNFVLAYNLGVVNSAGGYLSRLENRPDDRKHLKITHSIPVFQVEIDVASKTPKQEEDETDYYPRDEAVENIPKTVVEQLRRQSIWSQRARAPHSDRKWCPPDDSARRQRTSANIAESPDDLRQTSKHKFIAISSSEQRNCILYG